MEHLHRLINSILEDVGFLDMLLIWVFLIIGPFMLCEEGLSKLRKTKRTKRDLYVGIVYLVGFVTSLLFAGWLVIAHGRDLVSNTIAAGGGLLIAIVVCIVAFPICVTGWELRKGIQNRSGRALSISVIGLTAITGLITLTFFFVSSDLAFIAVIITLLALAVGWFGNILVPEL